MIEILNKNTKIKIISLLSAIVLWMYFYIKIREQLNKDIFDRIFDII